MVGVSVGAGVGVTISVQMAVKSLGSLVGVEISVAERSGVALRKGVAIGVKGDGMIFKAISRTMVTASKNRLPKPQVRQLTGRRGGGSGGVGSRGTAIGRAIGSPWFRLRLGS